jgi:hypothetical protein
MTQPVNHLPDAAEEMLLDAGYGQDAELRAALLALAAFASLPAPEPSGALAAMMAGPTDEFARKRSYRRHRITVVGLAISAGMGLGVSGVAASSAGHGEQGSHSVQQLLADWAPSWSILPVPPASAAPPASETAGQPLAPETVSHATTEPVLDTGTHPVPAGAPKSRTLPDTRAVQGHPAAGNSAGPERTTVDGGGAAAKVAGPGVTVQPRETGQKASNSPGDSVKTLKEANPEKAGPEHEKTQSGDEGTGTRGAGIRDVLESTVPALRDQGGKAAGAGPQADPRSTWLTKFSR